MKYFFGTKKTELLFVERMTQLLLEKCQLEGIVSMPSGVFRPYAGVSTAVLIFTKGGRTQCVWFYKMEKDGYSLDDKRNFIDGKGDIPDIIERYKKRREERPTDRKGK
ncbi:MAG: SAM-dependent methyltransferase [Methanothrix sp.]|jgi:type I restriction enzyme M protein|nr:SAM-dependent methyltransferase [Methanothrix sp.]